ncbi:MAG: M60 family metallopeptidase [Akkermansiaceae bacterium]|nr:M60 family metallopeptidase [Akkermansiaceae bacterium]
MKFLPVFRALLMSVFAVATCPANDADRAVLLDKVKEINTGGVPGGLCVYGPEAFVVVAGKEGKDGMLPVVAASRMGKGRVVAFGHDGFLSSVDQKDTGRLLVNSIRWAAGAKEKPRIGLFAIHNTPRMLAFFQAAGMEAVNLPAQPGPLDLGGIDVLCLNGIGLEEGQVDSIETWARAGGGLVAGVTGWGWVQIRGGNDRGRLATDCAANHLRKKAGIVFSSSTPGRTAPEGYVTGGELHAIHAGDALDALLHHTGGRIPIAAGHLNRCGVTLGDAIRSLPPDDEMLRPQLDGLPVRGGPFTPLRPDDILQRLVLTRDLEAMRRAKPEEIKAHEASRIFPGVTPAEAPRLERHTAALDLSVPQWQGLGLYAPAGEVVRISIPPEFAGKGLAVRIGCHTDTIWHLDVWKRAPEISMRRILKEPVTAVASPFGGLIYIEIPQGGPEMKMEVTVSGAVESPRFVLGKSSTTDWERMRNLQAPWGELETKKVVLSLPKAILEKVDDPKALLEFWDRVLDAQADLSTIPHERKRPERIVPDLQISGGYMHSGYPIMTHLDGSAETAANLERLSAGSWGHFHELGHNHQQPDWTFDGTVEVTCNLYTLYVTEMLCGNPPNRGHEQMQPLVVAAKLRQHLSQPDKFERWKKDPFLALIMYDQLRAAFGWDTYKKVFAEYRTLAKDERPKNDDEKRDQWMVRFSKAAGKNLGPFFEAWGVPTSEAARQSIADLPEWMPGG